MLYQTSSYVVFMSRNVKFNELPEESASCENFDEGDDSFVAPNWLYVSMDLPPKK